MADLDWHGDAAMDHVRSRAKAFITRAVIEVVRRAKELLSVAGSRHVHSAPGEPPRKQTGRLRASVTYEVTDLTARAGTNVEYGKFLELGSKRGIAPRPWLRRALEEMRTRVDQLLSQIGG